MEAYLRNFTRGILTDAPLSATPEHYERRATQLAAVGTPRCDEMALACRNAARFWRVFGAEIFDDEFGALLDEVA